MRLELLPKKTAVNARFKRQERVPETWRKYRMNSRNGSFSAADLGSEAAQKMLHRLIGIKPGYRRKNAERIAGQHDDVRRMARPSCGRCKRYVLKRIGAASVFGQRAVGKVDFLRPFVKSDVFQNCSEHGRRGEDFRFVASVEIQGLCVAAAFEIENAAVRPPVLVVPDQNAPGVGGKCRLAGA